MNWLESWNIRNFPINVLQRFWSKVQISYLEDGSPDFEKCMLWTGSKSPKGYGQFQYKTGILYRAHRFSFECFNKDDITGLVICHTCDTPSCVNPNHLFKGTHLDNIQDKIRKGRQPKGRQEHTCILSKQDVFNILSDVYNKKYKTIDTLADAYNVSTITIRRILNGITWKKETYNILLNSGISLYNLRNMIMGKEKYKLTESEAQIIKNLLKEGVYTQAQIARQFSLDPSTISMINIGRNWQHT